MTTASQSERLSARALGKFWTVPNVLSLTRLILVIPVFYLLMVDGPVGWILTLIFIGIGTDWIDGQVARWSNAVSEWGKILDPVADKVASIAVVLALVLRGTLPLWFLLVLVVRDLAIVLGGVYLAPRVKHVVMSMWWGKVAVTAVAITVVLAILQADPEVLTVALWVTTFLLVYSFGEYVLRFVRMLRAAQKFGDAADVDGAGKRSEPHEVDAPR